MSGARDRQSGADPRSQPAPSPSETRPFDGDDVSSHTNIVHTERPLVSVTHVRIEQACDTAAEYGLSDVADLYALFLQVKDPRQARGVRHHIAAELTVMVCHFWPHRGGDHHDFAFTLGVPGRRSG
jgi:hypothetical protein